MPAEAAAVSRTSGDGEATWATGVGGAVGIVALVLAGLGEKPEASEGTSPSELNESSSKVM